MKRYDSAFKEQVISECLEVGDIALVARRHGLSKNTVRSWISASRRAGFVRPLSKGRDARISDLEKRPETVSTENDRLKRLVAEKELELAVLRELRDRVNPR